ncbi:uncharacterized protein [Engystomops pustulosus]|uniref:uncharacterized protein n=1 Tax=Engystomops pustulosus TaxID=76066 RepID=UPI003AFAC6AE
MQLALLMQSSLAASTWSSHGSPQPKVWLVGHSYIYWAARRAAVRPGGLNLGFMSADLSWRGIKGLKCLQVLSEVVAIGKQSPGPTVLVIHAGGNDMCSTRLAALVLVMKSDIERFAAFFSDLVVVWSEVIPRVIWNGARNPESIERACRMLKMRVSRFVRSRCGMVIRHRQLEGDNAGLMLDDGVHLNDIGLDIFLSELQDAIERALFLVGGGRSTV